MSEEDDLKQIIDREEPGSKGPWKWQLINAIERVECKLEALLAIQQLKEKKASAGRKSAEARKEKFGTARPTQNSVREQKKKCVREQKSKTPGSAVWDSYLAAYQKRYPIPPLRNAKVNKECSRLVEIVGADVAIDLVAYYVTRSDAFYTNASHPLWICLRDAQKLVTEAARGKVITMAEAKRGELKDHNKQVVDDYLREQDQVRMGEDDGF